MIEATGGLIANPDGTHGCAGDPEWIDLADAALKAQRALASVGIEKKLTIEESSSSEEDE
jgi:hypothetical protein